MYPDFCLQESWVQAEEVGQIIVNELETAGFSVKWDKTGDTKIAVNDFKWDKYYVDHE